MAFFKKINRTPEPSELFMAVLFLLCLPLVYFVAEEKQRETFRRPRHHIYRSLPNYPGYQEWENKRYPELLPMPEKWTEN